MWSFSISFSCIHRLCHISLSWLRQIRVTWYWRKMMSLDLERTIYTIYQFFSLEKEFQFHIPHTLTAIVLRTNKCMKWKRFYRTIQMWMYCKRVFFFFFGCRFSIAFISFLFQSSENMLCMFCMHSMFWLWNLISPMCDVRRILLLYV